MDERTTFRIGDEGVDGYRLLTALVVPRPIAWVSTLDESGRGNLAPHSFFSVASADPPTVMFTSVGHKDTVRNVTATGEFTISVATAGMLQEVNDSSAPFEHGEDEAQALGVAMAPSHLVAPPRVRDSPAAIECRLDRLVEVGSNTVVLGTVLGVDVATDALDGSHPTMAALQPLSRLGRDEWGRPPEVFSIERPASVEDTRRGR
ncbi:flavin reductase [Marmoricola endophyticus]|uniref:Flavin reductase n=1 Tax=Marmoricola endophyticus TaxID=2040280 RepID=A0A917BAN2_9ACTN|nr:flavin reductase family protein [Marmoricola endophyticus]GGF34786.1 flavin reductase [Marmoricola endophyticus]